MCSRTKTDTGPLVLPLFHSGDEIFKQHFCFYLIACQHTLHKDSSGSKLVCLSWGHLGFIESGKRRDFHMRMSSCNNNISNS